MRPVFPLLVTYLVPFMKAMINHSPIIPFAYFRNLGGTQISFLPGKDLEYLEYLYIRGVESLWKIPVVNFKRLERAKVEYPFHCCLIHSQQRHNGLTGFLPPNLKHTRLISPNCDNKTDFVSTTSTTPHTTTNKMSSHTPFNILTLSLNYCIPENATLVPSPSLQTTLNCTPNEDAFNPCDNLLGSDGLRVCSWIVLVLAVLGNSFKLFVLLMSKRKIPITRILMCNLAIANLCMGIFLCMLASADLYSKGHYQNFALRWQYSGWCDAAGFVSIFSTELAVFVLTVITVERYFTIVHPLKRNKHLNVKQIILLIVIGWFFSLTMAALPVLPYKISGYEKVAICLPFEVEGTASKIYVTFLLTTNGLAFFFVLFCYGRMYCSLGGSGSRDSTHRVERRVAKRMAMLVITYFACWFPIALVSLIAVYGQTLISVPTAKFFLVFVYPINSFTNPYLYAIGTKHFQLDALEIIGRLGICNSAIKNLSNRLRDELETIPCSSRGTTGSKISLNSIRSPNQTPMASSRENNNWSSTYGDSWKSYNESMRSSNNSHQSVSSTDSTACSPCNILSIPSIHRKNYTLREQREKFDSSSRFNQQDDSTENIRPSSQSSDRLEKLSAGHASEREIFLEGKIFSLQDGRSQGGAANDSDENAPLQPEDTCSVKTRKEGERKQENSPLLRVPTLIVTSC